MMPLTFNFRTLRTLALGQCGHPWGLHDACADWLWAPGSAVDNYPTIQENLKH